MRSSLRNNPIAGPLLLTIRTGVDLTPMMECRIAAISVLREWLYRLSRKEGVRFMTGSMSNFISFGISEEMAASLEQP